MMVESFQVHVDHVFGSICEAQTRANRAEKIVRGVLDDLQVATTPTFQMATALTNGDSHTNHGDLQERVGTPEIALDGNVAANPQASVPETLKSTSPEVRDGPVADDSRVNLLEALKSTSPRARDIPAADDPQAQLISSLRSQISDLFSQVTQLNSKLVQSYDRVSDLEDNIHITSSNLRTSSLKISQLELERTQHLAALNTGLLVEKDHVTHELTRLMERATDEAARRGQAESARADIEKDLDDLSATLFEQANTMVAEARLQRARSERKVVEAEAALKGAEEAVSSMQLQMQQLRDEKEKSDGDMHHLQETMGKGKWIERASTSTMSLRLLSLPTPYQEFLLFVAHLRSIRPSSLQPPAMSTLLPLPFLARLLSEDSDPTVRLDFAPSLNWLSRRSVLSAIYNGQLTIEPISSTTLLLESSSSLIASPMIPSPHANLSCALCGASIFPSSSNEMPPPPHHPLSRNHTGSQGSNSWSTSLFKNALTTSANPSPPLTPPLSHTQLPQLQTVQPQQVHVFRLAQTAPPSLPQQTQPRPTNYPLCPSGWCLLRLRTTCSLWAFVRAGVVDKVWEEEVPIIHAPVPQRDKAPPLPPRRRSKMGAMSMGSLWGMASGALGKEKSPSKGEVSAEKGLPNPPPSHPDLLPAVKLTTTAVSTLSIAAPPLPRRSIDRDARSRQESPVVANEDRIPHASAENKQVSSEKEEHSNSTQGEIAPEVVPPADPTTASAKDGHSDATVVSVSSEVPPPANPDLNNEVTATPKVEGHRIPAPSLAISTPSGSEMQDTFSTPFEELDSMTTETSTAAPHVSPATIPLPESTPVTPIGSGFPRGVQSHHVTHPVQTILSEKEKSAVPSRSGSPAAPPLPRRAPARRPVPGPPGSLAQASPQSPATPLLTEAPPPSGGATAHTGDDKLQFGQPEVNGVGEALTSTSSGVQIENPDKSAHDHSVAPAQPPAYEEQKVSSPAGEETLQGPFVGDTTWEERTWKEVVRLREDMFWARIGALRC